MRPVFSENRCNSSLLRSLQRQSNILINLECWQQNGKHVSDFSFIFHLSFICSYLMHLLHQPWPQLISSPCSWLLPQLVSGQTGVDRLDCNIAKWPSDKTTGEQLEPVLWLDKDTPSCALTSDNGQIGQWG